MRASILEYFCLWCRICIDTRDMTAMCVMSKAWLSVKTLHLQSRVWPQTNPRAPATSALHRHHNALSHSGSGHLFYFLFFCTRGSNGSKGDGWGWQTHRSMLFPSFEIAIRADLIKPACIIEVFQETLTGSRYLCTSPARSTGNFGGVATETFARNVNQTSASCVSPECM